MSVARAREIAEAIGATDSIDWTLAAAAIRLREGVAVDVTPRKEQ